ncbi:Uncharacterised protein [Capnocytophaga ochracea]|uniref:Uncharacterized protein n=1 Tax=Capnocytophaga ochracea TaxID=1018 RepID=A0A2X2SWU7_CAPOC|nr:Uncharacterised protein [Capnocytophaga ochracea]VDG81385.1 Uncharacterised protein [Capnocytophaga ochracea]
MVASHTLAKFHTLAKLKLATDNAYTAYFVILKDFEKVKKY